MFSELSTAGICTTALLSSLSAIALADTTKSPAPNIVVIFCDDLGYGDLSCLNPKSAIKTPAMDRLGNEGVIFTDAHSNSAVSSPSRYGLLTGRYAWRSRLKRGVLMGYSSHLISPDRMTIADVAKKRGYNTACIGKWHLGMDFPKKEKGSKWRVNYNGIIANGPNQLGFDYYFGISASLDMPPYVYIENNKFTESASRIMKARSFPDYMRGGEIGESFTHIGTLDLITDKAVKFIKENSNKTNPFLLYLPLTSPHKPVLPAKRFQGKSGIGPYGDFVMQTDDTVRRILETLDTSKISDNTLVILTSDNASFMKRLDESGHKNNPTIQGFNQNIHQSNHIWRGTKTDIYEGGHRVPFLVRWPQTVKANSVCDTTVCITDIFRTCADILNVKVEDNCGEDSFTLLPYLKGQTPKLTRAPVVHHSANGSFSLRKGDWKMIFTNGSGGRQKPAGRSWTNPYQLYNIKSDPSETSNLINDKPEIAKALTIVMDKIITDGRSNIGTPQQNQGKIPGYNKN